MLMKCESQNVSDASDKLTWGKSCIYKIWGYGRHAACTQIWERKNHFHFPNFSVFYLCRRHLKIGLESQTLPRLPDAIVALVSSFKEARSAQLWPNIAAVAGWVDSKLWECSYSASTNIMINHENAQQTSWKKSWSHPEIVVEFHQCDKKTSGSTRTTSIDGQQGK